jgi:general secretion pathway protein A
MFTTFFKMTGLPFEERAPVERLLADERVTQALARLRYFAEDGTVALLTGDTGVGKSSTVKLFLESLPKNRYQPLYLHLTRIRAMEFLKLLVSSLGEIPRRGKERLFLQILEKTQNAETTTLFIIDEAHLLDPDALVDLRLLVSSALEKTPPLKILLVGQRPLRDQLRQARHADLLHRICVSCHLDPLTKEQTGAYIDFRLRGVGGPERLFPPEVKAAIHDYTRGIPRLINNLATACLINAAARRAQQINEALLNDTLGDIQLV